MSAEPKSLNVREYYRAVEISHMKRLMRYDQAKFEEDWNVALALAKIMSQPYVNPDTYQRMLEGCFQRMLAYMEINPDAKPF
jgi:hypothetical protein